MWRGSVNNSWPGEALTKYDTDENGRDIYVYKNVDIEKYENCIFNLGISQTGNLNISDALNGNNCFYLTDNNFDSGEWRAPDFLG